MSRYRASSLHLLVSFLTLLLIFLVISQIWYPGVLFLRSAGIHLLTILAGVDLTVGPLITLIIFDAKKKLIKMDMAIIFCCQILFMSYGLWTVFASRPVFIAFTGHNFYMVKANEIEDKDLGLVTNTQFKQLPKFGPVFVGTKEPEDIKVHNDIVFAGAGGMGIQNLPQYYVGLSQVQKQLIAEGKTSQQFTKIDADSRQRLVQYEKDHPAIPLSFLLMGHRGVLFFVAINSQTGAIVDIV